MGNRDEFFAKKIIQDAVIRNLEIIGEANKNLSETFRGDHPDIPLKQIAGLRYVLIHHYFGVELESIWLVVESRLSGLLTSPGTTAMVSIDQFTSNLDVAEVIHHDRSQEF